MSFNTDNTNVSHEAACSQCGHIFRVNDMIHYEHQWICSSCKSLFFQKLKEGVPVDGTFHYGGFWIRFLAKLLDTVILSIVSTVLMSFFIVFELINQTGVSTASFEPTFFNFFLYATQIVIGFGYPVFFVGKFGATPGKMICHLKIITAEGDSVGYGRATARMFAELLSSLILSIGYLMAAFDDEKKTLHDLICNTRVIRTNR